MDAKHKTVGKQNMGKPAWNMLPFNLLAKRSQGLEALIGAKITMEVIV